MPGGGPSDFLLKDLDYPYPSDFGPQLQIFPKVNINTNHLAGHTNAIELARFENNEWCRTNDMRLIEHRKRVNDLLDWLQAQPRQKQTNFEDSHFGLFFVGGKPPSGQSVK